MRERDGKAQRLERFGDGEFVRGVGERKEEGDGDGLGGRLAYRAAKLSERRFGWSELQSSDAVGDITALGGERCGGAYSSGDHGPGAMYPLKPLGMHMVAGGGTYIWSGDANPHSTF